MRLRLTVQEYLRALANNREAPMPLGNCKVCGVVTKPSQKFCDQHRPMKFRNQKVEVSGLFFDSMAEAARYQQLAIFEEQGTIEGWDWKGQIPVPLRHARQQRFPLVVNGQKVCAYVADFVYRELPSMNVVVEDYKGHKTDVYRLKAKLFAACLGFPITEIRRPSKRKAGSA